MSYFWVSQLRKDFLWAFSYKISFFGQFIGVGLSVYTLFFISKTFEMSKSTHLIEYGDNYFLFAIIGICTLDLINLCMRSATRSVRDAQAFGYIDVMISSKVNPRSVVISSLVYPFLIGLLRVIVYLFCAFLLQDLNFSLLSITLALCIMLLTLISFMGLSLIAASFVILYKQGDPINYFTGLIIFLFSGVLFPVSALPEVLKPISSFLPMTHSLEMMRKILIFDSCEHCSFSTVGYLLFWSAILYCFGIIILRKAIELSRVSGNLGKY